MQYKSKTQTLVMTALFAALLAILCPLAIPVGPIPFTLAIFMVYLTGAMLPPAMGLAAVGIYVLLGCTGLPVFSGMRGGPQVLVGATGGYIAGYFLIVLAVSLAMRRSPKWWVHYLAGVAGLAACYLLGTLWYTVVSGAGFLSGLAVCVVPFAIPDLIKGALALGLARLLKSRLRGALG